MRQELTRTFAGLIFALLFPAFAMADAGLTYHGRLLKPDGKPVTGTNVQFLVQVRTPVPTSCLLFQETHVRNLSDTQGVFSLTLNDGATVGNGEPFTLAEAFQNHGRLLSFPSGKCSGDDEYTPNPSDGRQLFVSFNDGTFSGWEPLPPQNIAFVPLALDSRTVGGHKAGNFFRVEGASGPETLGAWSVANYGKLTSLIGNVTISGGNASIGGNAAGFTGSLSGDVTGGQLTTKVEKIQGREILDTVPTNGQFLKWNDAQSRWEPGDVAVAGNPAWNDITGKPAEFPPGGGATGDLTGSYPNPTIADEAVFGSKILDGGVAFGKIAAGSATGQVLQYETGTGTGWKADKLLYTNLVNNVGGSPWPGVCAAGSFMNWNSGTDAFECVALTNAMVAGALTTLPVSKGGTGATTEQGARTNLLPGQGGNAGKFLQTDGGDVSWVDAPATGVTSINGATGTSQTFTTAQANTSPAFTRVGDTHTLEIPLASTNGVSSGTISHADYQTFSGKQNALGFTPLDPANNLSELADASAARSHLGLGTAATKNFGTLGGNLVELDAGGKIPAALLPSQSGTFFAQGGNAFGAPAILGTTDAEPLILQTGGTDKVTILDNGNVGIGVTPLRKFHVKADGAYQMRLENASTGGGFWNIGQADNVFGAGGGKLLFVPNSDSSTDATVTFTNAGRVGIGTTSPGSQLDVAGALRLTTTTMDSYTTPAGSSVPTKVNIPHFDPGTYGQIVSMGVPSGAAVSSRVLSLFDQRSGAHAPTLAVFSPNESKMIGFSWDGSDTMGAVKSTAGLALQADGDISILPTAGNNVYQGDTIMGSVDYGAMLNMTTSSRVADGLALTIKGDLGGPGRSSVYIETDENDDDRYLLRAAGNGGAVQALAVASSGNVGIGKANPQSRLDVAGTIRAQEICDESGDHCKDISSGWGAGGDIDGIVTNSGSGLSGGVASGTATLSLVTDGSTLEVNGSNQLQVKDSGITDAKIASLAVNKITGGAGLYLTYAPDGTSCTPGQVLKWNNSRWECGTDSDFTSPLTTRGDIYIRDTNVDTRLPAGADGKVLKADSSQGAGLVWGDAIASDISSLVTTGIVQRNAANSYSTVTVASPLTYTGGTLGLDATSFGDVKIGGNAVGSTMTLGTNSAHDLAFETGGTTKMTILEGGNVGIGTASPGYPLHVNGNIGAKGAITAIGTDGSYRTAMSGGDSDGYVSVRNNSLENKVMINSNGNSYFNGGNVGIGTTSPQSSLHVQGSPVGAIRLSSSAASAGVIDMYQGANYWRTRHYESGSGSAPSALGFGYNQVSPDMLAISKTGNVGIGTTAPASSLHVNRSASVTTPVAALETTGASGRPFLNFKAEGTDYGWVGFGSTGNDHMGLVNYRNARLDLGTDGLVRMVILGNGNVGVGTTTPSRRLHVSHSVNSDYSMQITNGGGTGHGLLINAGSTGNASVVALNVADYAGASLFYVRGDGGYYHLGSPISTKESKKDIRVFDENALSLLKDIQVVSYRYKMDADDRAPRIGFLANDENHVYDERLTNKQRGFATETIVGVMIKAFQEISENVSQLIASVTGQGEQLENLEKTVHTLQGQLRETKMENQDLRLRLERLEKALSGEVPARRPAQQTP